MDNEKWTTLEMHKLAKQYVNELDIFSGETVEFVFNEYDGVPGYFNNTDLEFELKTYKKYIEQIPSYCGMPYIATLDNISGFDMLTVLCVSPYKEDEQFNLRQTGLDNVYQAMAYCINLDEPTFSEAGTVTIKVDRQNQTLRRIY